MSESVYPISSSDMALDALKVPPHSVEAEQSVLGGLLLDNGSWDRVAELLDEEDFYRRDHRLIFRAVRMLIERAEPCDVVTLSERLASSSELDEVGGLAYLGGLAKNTPSAANIKAYAEIVRERSVLRQLAHVGNEIANSAYQTEGKESVNLLDEAEKMVFDIADRGRGGADFLHISQVLTEVVERIGILHEQEEAIIGVSTGYADLDRKTSGLQPSDLIILAGRPSMGKTSFAMNLAEHIAIKGDAPVAVFSMELPSEQLVMRMLSSLGHIDQNRVRTGQLLDDDWPRLTSAMTLLNEAKLYIDDSPGLSPLEVRARARRLMREHGQLGLIVIDYLQLMQSSSGRSENRTSEITEISRSLKALAKELKVPVIALSQLNRNLEQRTDKRPVMSDLRESGAIEQDADLVVFIYRDEVYNEDSPDKGIAEIIIAKQRNGPIGKIKLAFMGQYTRFENLAHDAYFNPQE